MDNNFLVKTLLKSVMPTVTKFVESGKIDALFRELKARFDDRLKDSENSTVEILITTEDDGLEYVSFVELGRDLRIKQVMHQQRLSELVKTLFTQADL